MVPPALVFFMDFPGTPTPKIVRMFYAGVIVEPSDWASENSKRSEGEFGFSTNDVHVHDMGYVTIPPQAGDRGM